MPPTENVINYTKQAAETIIHSLEIFLGKRDNQPCIFLQQIIFQLFKMITVPLWILLTQTSKTHRLPCQN